jgi:hypothetical protein
MADLVNKLQWSHSRIGMLRECKRRYYLNYYQKWFGWNADATPEQRQAYTLCKMTNLPMLVGVAVHEAVKRSLLDIRDYGRVTVPDLAMWVRREFLTAHWLDAQDELWKENPKKHPPMFEIYYGQEPSGPELKAWGEKVTRCLARFQSSSLFQDLLQDNPENWLAMDLDPFGGRGPSLTVNETTVLANPDFARRTSDGLCEVWDWKTGRPRNADELQLLAYGLFAHDAWGFPPEAIRLRAFYLDPDLSEQAVVEYSFNEAQLDRIRKDIASGVDEMTAVLQEEGYNQPLDKEAAFPMTEQAYRCATCHFKEVCDKV